MNQGGFEFNLLGIPVRVLPMFFLIMFLFGAGFRDPVLIAIFVGLAFVAILAHELGHALAYRAFGVQPSIQLHGFGGLTFGRSLPTGQSLLVSLAGPFTGLLLGAPVWWLLRTTHIPSATTHSIMVIWVFVTIVWSLFNLLPLLPLDGGNALNALLSMIFKRDMTGPTRIISLFTAGLLVLGAVAIGELFLAMFGAYFAVMNIIGLSQQGARPGPRAWRPTITKPGQAPPSSPSAPKAGAESGEWTMPTQPPPTRPAEGAPTPPPAQGPAWTPPARTYGPQPRTFAQEVDTAARALSDDEPALAMIAVDRARGLATTADDHAVVDQLQNEILRRMGR